MWNESLILIRLTQAKIFLERLPQSKREDFNIWQFRIRFEFNEDELGGGNSLDIAPVKASEREDENSVGVKFLLGLLKCANQVLAYAAIKTLVAFSEFLRNTRRDLWPSFLLALWKDAQCWVVCPDPESLKKVHVYGKAFIQNGAKELSSQAHKDACLTATSNTLQALHQSLKRCLKLPDNTTSKLLSRKNVESLETFLCLLTTRVNKVAAAICTADDKGVGEQKSELILHHFSDGLPSELALGSLLRLLCTGASIPPAIFITTKDFIDVSFGAYLDMSQDLIPIISSYGLALHKNCSERTCISSYLRHKLLMLMLKLSEWFEPKPSLASSCYTALRHHGSDLLDFSLQRDNKEKKLTDESPFIESLLAFSPSEIPAVPSIRPLQRRALVLLLKIGHAARPSADTHRGSASVQYRVILPTKRSWEEPSPPCTCELPTRMYLRDWMKKQYSLKVFDDSEEMPSLEGICEWVNRLATALIQLYLGEDDLLFILMTQLLNMPFLSSIFMCPKHPAEDMFCTIVVQAFLPTSLFHAFLAAIHFDYSTVEKLLMSKTSGVLCLAYLMRSLRHVSDSWPEFIHRSPCADSKDHFPDRGHELKDWKDQTHTLQCSLCSYEEICSHGVVPYDEKVIQKYMADRRNAYEKLDRMSKGHHPHLFLKEIEFLQQLKLRIENLHRHALFPYNPTPLLKRLSIVVDLFESRSTRGH